MKIKINTLLFVLCSLCSSWAFPAQPAQITPLALKSLMTDIGSHKNTVISVGELGHILFSKDQGSTWSQANVPVDTLLTSITVLNENTAWAVGHDGVVIKTEDGGANWKLLYSTLDYSDTDFVDPLLDVTFWNDKKGIAVGAFGQLYFSYDGGKNWKNKSLNLPNEDQLHLNSIIRTNDKKIVIASEYGTIFYSKDDGDSWSIIKTPAEATLFSIDHDKTSNKIISSGVAGNVISFNLDNEKITKLSIQTEQSLYAAKYYDGQLHLLGTNSTWITDQELTTSPQRSDYHAITFIKPGLAAIATSTGVKVVHINKSIGGHK